MALLAAVWSPFWSAQRVDNTYRDWSFRVDYMSYALHALREDHQLPLWVTDARFEQLRMAGIHEFFANPETEVLSLVTPLAALWGYLTALKLALLFYLALGVYGCQRLLRCVAGEARIVPTLVTALLALGNGALAGHVLAGHTQFASVAALPLALALCLESHDARRRRGERLRRAAWAGALLALSYYAGNTHPLLLFLLAFVVLLPLIAAFTGDGARVTLPSSLVTALSFGGLAAFKLLPGARDFGGYRPGYTIRYGGLPQLVRNLVQPWDARLHFAHELNVYVGWLGLALLLLGLGGLRSPRQRALIVTTLVVSCLMFVPLSRLPLPLLRAQGAVTRIRLVAIFGLAVASGAALQALLARAATWPTAARRGVTVAAALVVALFAGDLRRANFARHVAAAHDALPAPHGPYDVPIALTAAGPGIVASTRVRANDMEYEYALPAPGLLVAPSLPATPAPHLALEGDGALTTSDGALAVRTTRASGRVRLRFQDRGHSLGLLVTLLAALSLLASRWLGRRREAG